MLFQNERNSDGESEHFSLLLLICVQRSLLLLIASLAMIHIHFIAFPYCSPPNAKNVLSLYSSIFLLYTYTVKTNGCGSQFLPNISSLKSSLHSLVFVVAARQRYYFLSDSYPSNSNSQQRPFNRQ